MLYFRFKYNEIKNEYDNILNYNDINNIYDFIEIIKKYKLKSILRCCEYFTYEKNYKIKNIEYSIMSYEPGRSFSEVDIYMSDDKNNNSIFTISQINELFFTKQELRQKKLDKINKN